MEKVILSCQVNLLRPQKKQARPPSRRLRCPDEPPPIDPNSAIDGAIAAHDDDSDNDGDEDEKDEDDLEEPEDEEPDIHLAVPEQDAPEAAAPNEGAPKVATMEQV